MEDKWRRLEFGKVSESIDECSEMREMQIDIF